MSAVQIENLSSRSCDSVWARRVIRSSRAATRMAPSCQSVSKRDPLLECAPGGGQIERLGLTVFAGFPGDGSHDEASITQRRLQAPGRQEFVAGETLHAWSKRHDISRQLIWIWVGKLEAGALDDDAQAANLIQEYEARIAALERPVGRQALELEFQKGTRQQVRLPKSASSSVVTGPDASP